MGVNDYIKKYLEYHKGDPLIPRLVDKLEMKELVGQYTDVALPRTLPLDYDTESYVVKATNDSGSTCVVRNNQILTGSYDRIMRYKDRPYGLEKGEWFYGEIPHRVIKEEYLGDNPSDYKFHMHKGKLAFMQIMSDRFSGKKSCTVLPNRTYSKYSLEKGYMEHKQLPLPPMGKYLEMLEHAKKLSAPWKYVRVDFYLVNGKVYLGELTFAPRAGNYKNHDQKPLGKQFRR